MVETEHPDKMYYSIGDVQEMTEIEPHVLRFWESTFPTLKPRRNTKGQRTYQKKDIEKQLKIKELLYKQKYTVKGAISVLKVKKEKAVGEKGDENREFLLKVRHELKSLLKGLEGEKREDLFDG